MLGSNPEKISVQSAVDSFQKNWDDLYAKKTASGSKEEVGLIWPLLKSFGLRLLWSNTIAFLHYSIVFVSPQARANPSKNTLWQLRYVDGSTYFYARLMLEKRKKINEKCCRIYKKDSTVNSILVFGPSCPGFESPLWNFFKQKFLILIS